jgi:DNA repair photolyase
MAFKSWDKIDITTDQGDVVEGIAPIIISASRSTDIPAFYAKWFLNRLDKGYVKWINPFNRKPQYVSFQKTRVIVFWTKNPKPIIPYLEELDKRGIHYYFQFTINDYEKERLEPNVPRLKDRIETFKKLSNQIGKERVVWRFDPLILTDTVDVDLLLNKIESIGNRLISYTKKLVFSFADIDCYRKVQNNLKRDNVQHKEFDVKSMEDISEKITDLNKQWGFELATCGESIDLSKYGIDHNKCIDDGLMIKLFKDDKKLMNFLGYEEDLFSTHIPLKLKDKGQRKECGCIVSKDIGMYNTCSHLCKYCYANTSENMVLENRQKHQNGSDGII